VCVVYAHSFIFRSLSCSISLRHRAGTRFNHASRTLIFNRSEEENKNSRDSSDRSSTQTSKMKFTAALSLLLTPLVVAKAVHNVYPVQRRSPHSRHLAARNGHEKNSVTGLTPSELALLGLSGVGITETSVKEVIILWINGGGGAATTVINAPVTTTVTVQAGNAAATSVASEASSSASASTTVAATASTVASGAGATHTVTVGGPAGLVFSPSEVKAAIGDTVIFTFLSQNHTATQSAFATPCEALAGGMDSGFQPNPSNSVNPPPQVAMQVMVDTPLWFYCKQAGHCGKGMTFSINPTAAKTQAMFQAMAIAQNGTGSSTTITGGTSAGNGTGSSSSAAESSTLAALPSSTAAADAGSSATTVAASAASTTVAAGVAVGTGVINTDGSCACAVVCQVGAFPAVAQGVGAFGGLSGETSTPSSLTHDQSANFDPQVPYPPP
jgi:plastocyanin